jgi:ferredoxin
MADKILARDKISGFIDDLVKGGTLYAPVLTNGYVSFESVSSSRDVILDYFNSKKTPKEFFFPQNEEMFRFERDDYGRAPVEPHGVDQRILFGIRPCDVSAILRLDNVFLGEDYVDPYYKGKRENTIIITMACSKPRSTCFCTTCGIGPFDEDGSDVFVVDLGDMYLLRSRTKKGDEIIDGLSDAAVGDMEKFEVAKASAESFVTSKIDLERLKEGLQGIFEDEIWSRICEKCIGCGTCTYLCSTCQCFDIVDERLKAGGRRIRIWDSCMFPLFTLHTSGHNPREGKMERMRQRVMHKFSYFPNRYGPPSCVGCGRCIVNCPVNFDIREVLQTLSAKL